MAKLTVYGTPISVYVRIVRLILEETGTDYELKPVDIFSGENQTAEYLAKNPFGKVPTLEVNGEPIYETAAIVEYLNAAIADHKFSPADLLLQARMRQIMAIVDNYLYPNAITNIVIQRVIVPRQGGTTDEEKVSRSVAPAKTAMEAIEAVTIGQPYLLGSELSLADFYLIFIFVYLSRMPEYEAITAETPKLRAWWEQVQQLPNVKKVSS